jgi:hypothetical protein
VFVFAALPLPGWSVDRYVSLEELRREIGLEAVEQPLTTVTRRLISKHGWRAVMRKVVVQLHQTGERHFGSRIRHHWGAADLELPKEWDDYVGKVLAELRLPGRSGP